MPQDVRPGDIDTEKTRLLPTIYKLGIFGVNKLHFRVNTWFYLL